MNIAIACAEHEREMALRWFSWAAELGGTEGHKLFLLPVAGMDAKAIIQAAETAFPDAVTVLRDAEAIKSDWQSTDLARSAAGPNSAFRQVAWHFYMKKLGPFFFCELDCIPLKKGWIAALEEAYRKAGKPFMGAHVTIDKVPEHMSGNAVYSQDTVTLAPSIVMRTNWTTGGKEYELAFDIAGAKEIIPQAHWTPLIQHNFRHSGFASREDVDALVSHEAVVFHSNKDGSLIDILRGSVGAQASAPAKSGDGLLPRLMPARPPSDDTREKLAHDAVAVLKRLCTAPRYTGMVRRELKAQGVIK